MAASLIAIDWGSSAFRAFLLDQHGGIITSKSSNDGVFSIKNGLFFQILMENCGEWLKETPDLPIIMSGAIGSRNGWQEVPYRACPASVETLSAFCASVKNNAGLNIQIVPGVCGDNFFDGDDVMRGEEVQIFGALRVQGIRDALVCLPGTHSKWCAVKDGAIQSVTTFMTGEIYALLRRQSSIGLVIEETSFDQASFLAGLAAAKGVGGLLHNLFSVRADVLLGNLACASAESYLSGMVIGSELDAVQKVLGNALSVLLVGSDGLNQRYMAALTERGNSVTAVPADDAFVQGILMLHHSRDQAL